MTEIWKPLETRQKSSLRMYKPNVIIFKKVFKIIIIFQFKNFNSKLKKIYTQTTDLSTPGKKKNQQKQENRQ